MQNTLMLAVIFLPLLLLFQAPTITPRPTDTPKPAAEVATQKEEPPVVTKHTARVGGRTLNYNVTTGFMPIKNAVSGDTEARIFYMAYTLDGVSEPRSRPLMLSFNGGPGSASVWLHLGALGPRRVRMLDDGMMPLPPYEVADNEHSWLDQTDMVFIYPVGTGYSRATKPELSAKF